MNLAVVIVNHNTREHLDACLKSTMPERPAQTVVVDNASSDGSGDLVRRKYPHVELIQAGNEGFGGGANRGIRQVRHPFVLLLNSDTRVQHGAIDTLARYLENRPHVGLVGPRLLNQDGTLQLSIYPMHSPMAEMVRWTSVGRIAARIPSLRRAYLLDHPHDSETEVGWVVGAALALRKEAFEAIGGFDTSFFMYSEEVDLAYRMRKAGWAVTFTPTAEVWHVGGASTDAYRSEMMSRLFNSVTQFYRKHYGPHELMQLRAIWTYLMVRNLFRDRLRLLRASSEDARTRLASDLTAWRRVLATTWSS